MEKKQKIKFVASCGKLVSSHYVFRVLCILVLREIENPVLFEDCLKILEHLLTVASEEGVLSDMIEFVAPHFLLFLSVSSFNI
jgi:recombinational DNA repair protein (RecF pathway)